jgi:hypothetical protein
LFFVAVVGALSVEGMQTERLEPEERMLSAFSEIPGMLAGAPRSTQVSIVGEEAVVSEELSVSFPCTTKFLRLDPVDDDHSCAVYRILAHVGEQSFYLDDFVDAEHPLEHCREILQTKNHDSDLRTEALVRVFVLVGEEEHLVREETVFTAYPFADREEDRWNASPPARCIVRDYKRSDGSVLSQDRESFLHQSRIIFSVEDDKTLETRRTVETFVVMGGQEMSLKRDEETVAYAFSEREDHRAAEKRFVIVRDYRRGDGTILARDYQEFPYQERCASTVEEDASLATQQTIETFVTWGDPYKVLKTEVRSVPYVFTDREDHRDTEKKFAIVRDYKRSDGTILSKDYQVFPYQERCVKTTEDDQGLVTRRVIETFVAWGTPHKVLKTETRPTPYAFTEREDNRKAQKVVVVVRDYKRGDGSAFARDSGSFPYQERCVRTVDDDNRLTTERTFEMFVTRNPQVVRDTQVRLTPYPFTDALNECDRWTDTDVYHQQWLTRTYRRSNNTTLSRVSLQSETHVRQRDWWVRNVHHGDCCVQ